MTTLRTSTPAALLAALALLATAQAATAVPATRADAHTLLQRLQQAATVPAGWTGSTDRCDVGTESAASTAATLTAINVLREYAGLPPVSLDPAKNALALAAAVLMHANGDLDHSPPSTWKCYSEDGARGASRSNLYMGRSGADAMTGYVWDEGVESLGHRRWLLNPEATTFGTGSTGNYNALHVIPEEEPPAEIPAFVAWPPPGHVPWSLIEGEWSVTFYPPAPDRYSRPMMDLSGARASVTVDGVARQAGPVREANTNTAAFTPSLGSDRSADHSVAVTLDGITLDGVPQPATTYTIVALNFDPPSIRQVRYQRSAPAAAPGTELTISATVARAQSVTYQWLRNGRSIAGATGVTYRIVRGDRGRRIRCRIVALGPEGQRTAHASRPILVPRKRRPAGRAVAQPAALRFVIGS